MNDLLTIAEICAWGRYQRKAVEGWISSGTDALQVVRTEGVLAAEVVKVPKRALWQFLGGGKSPWRTYEQFREDWLFWQVDKARLKAMKKEEKQAAV